MEIIAILINILIVVLPIVVLYKLEVLIKNLKRMERSIDYITASQEIKAICKKCNKRIHVGQKICPFCGNKDLE